MAEGKPARKPRADALRNREMLLAVARDAFLSGEVSIAFDEIARRAGVGIGTLYRHFASRDVLVEALYRDQVDALARDADRLARDCDPLAALRAWMLLFVDMLVAKRVIRPVLEAAVGPDAGVFAAAGDSVKRAARLLAERAVAAGRLDPALDPIDLLRALAGVCGPTSDAGDRARYMVDILLAGARPGARS